MATFTNKVFKPRKDSGFVVKFRVNDKVVEEEQNNTIFMNMEVMEQTTGG